MTRAGAPYCRAVTRNRTCLSRRMEERPGWTSPQRFQPASAGRPRPSPQFEHVPANDGRALLGCVPHGGWRCDVVTGVHRGHLRSGARRQVQRSDLLAARQGWGHHTEHGPRPNVEDGPRAGAGFDKFRKPDRASGWPAGDLRRPRDRVSGSGRHLEDRRLAYALHARRDGLRTLPEAPTSGDSIATPVGTRQSKPTRSSASVRLHGLRLMPARKLRPGVFVSDRLLPWLDAMVDVLAVTA